MAAAHPGGLINLSMGTPVDPVPEVIRQALAAASNSPGYPLTAGTPALRAAITDWVNSLSRHGFERIYFLNGHGGNVHTIEAAFSELYAEASFGRTERGFACKLKNWWDLKGVTALANRLRVVRWAAESSGACGTT